MGTRVSLVRAFGAVLIFGFVSMLGHAAARPADSLALFRLILMTSPFLIGIWLGVSVKGRHALAYVLVGLLFGPIWLYKVSTQETAVDVVAFGPIFVALLLNALLTLSGGLVGDRIERRRRGASEAGGLAEALARRIAARRAGSPNEVDDQRIERLTAWLSGCEVLLALISAGFAAFGVWSQLFP